MSLNLKNDLRKKILQKRNAIYFEDSVRCASTKIISKILNSADFKNAKNIALYYPIQNEIDITSIAKNADKNFFLPKCIGLDMFFCKYKFGDYLKEGKYRIPEPQTETIKPDILDIIYIPALMANKNKYRLGYGKGYYDRFFSSNYTKAKKVIIVLGNFISNSFKEDEFDIQCDEIICEN